MGWSNTKGFRKRGWMTIHQAAADRSIQMGIQILQSSQPETLFKKLTVLVQVKKRGLPLGMMHKEQVISTAILKVRCTAWRKY